jgi:hypothetical protein
MEETRRGGVDEGRAEAGEDGGLPLLLERVRTLLQTSPGVEDAQRETVRNVYLFGSRVHRCHQPDADYDLIAVVEGPYFEGTTPALLSFLCAGGLTFSVVCARACAACAVCACGLMTCQARS